MPRNGEDARREDLVTLAMPGLRAYVRSRMGRRLREFESVSDIAQSACREVLDDLGRREVRPGDTAIARWLRASADRKLADRARFYGRARRAPGFAALPLDSLLQDRAGPCAETRHGAHPSRPAQVRDDRAQLDRCLARLPEDYRTVILLAHEQGLSRPEIARRLGRSEIAVRALLHRAMARLARFADRDDVSATG